MTNLETMCVATHGSRLIDFFHANSPLRNIKAWSKYCEIKLSYNLAMYTLFYATYIKKNGTNLQED